MDAKKNVLFGISILIIAVSVGFIFKGCKGNSVPIQTEPLMYLADTMANETVKLLGNKGDILVIVQKDESPGKMLQQQTDRFLAAIKKTGVTVKAVEALPNPQLAIGSEFSLERISILPLDLFFDLLEKNQGISAVVSFVGTPVFEEQDLSKFTEKTPKLIVFSPFVFSSGLKLKQLFKENVVQAAIVSRFEALPDSGKIPSTPEEWFKSSYQVVTAENAASLPDF